jgi:hypothetical protein
MGASARLRQKAHAIEKKRKAVQEKYVPSVTRVLMDALTGEVWYWEELVRFGTDRNTTSRLFVRGCDALPFFGYLSETVQNGFSFACPPRMDIDIDNATDASDGSSRGCSP